MCHDNEKWCKIWRAIDLSFQNWHEKFEEFWPEHLKVSKIFILMCSFWAKYIFFELKQYRGIIFHETEEGYKIGEESSCRFKIDIRILKKFDPSTRKSQKIFILMSSFWAKYILFELKKYRGIIFHESEEACKIWRGIDFSFQTGIRNLTKFDPSTRKSQKFSL